MIGPCENFVVRDVSDSDLVGRRSGRRRRSGWSRGIRKLKERAVSLLGVALLAAAAKRRDAGSPGMLVKSSMMLGLGERDAEVLEVMRDLRAGGVHLLALGQYLQPSKDHLPVDRFVKPEEFEAFREQGMALGFLHVESGALVRSSYHAERQRPDPAGKQPGPAAE